MIKYKKDTDNIVTLILDMGNRHENVVNHEMYQYFKPVLIHLQKEKAKGTLKGIILTSAKKNFLEGGELEYLHKSIDAKAIYEHSLTLNKFFRALEYPGVPVVAAINGSALGTGFEFALACHHRIVVDDSKIRLGHPEVTVGLMPGNGGITRLLWLLGLEKAYTVLTNGKKYRPQEALKVGIIDEIAPNQKAMLEQAKQWLLSNKEGRRPWDIVDGQIPEGTANDPQIAQVIQKLAAQLSKKTHNNYPAPQAILNTLVEGSKVDFDIATIIESRYFTELFGKFRAKQVGIIGAGRMGSGIAFNCVKKGLKVILKDVSKPIAEIGKQYAKDHLTTLVAQGTISTEEKDKLFDNIKTSAKPEDFENCDLVIEAVYENEMVKAKALKDAEQYIDEYAIFATNTLSIPITKLAEAAYRPENYVGLHFFYPVEKVPLVEIVRGKKTSDETIARAFDFVRTMGKIPIVVKDDWGFYVARVQNTYILEGITLLQEGYPPALIENLGLQAGMPKGALAFADAGFYNYTNDYKKLWPELKKYFPITKEDYNIETIKERMLFAQVIEAIWCMQEKVITSVPEANLGSIYGWGFPAFTGGIFQYVNSYGLNNFIEKCEQFQQDYGPRFRVPRILKK